MTSSILYVGKRKVIRNANGVFKIPYSKLDDFTPDMLPIGSSIEITGIKKVDGICFYITCTNGNDIGTSDAYQLFISVRATSRNRQEGISKIEKYRVLFSPFIDSGYLPLPMTFDLSKHFKNDYSFDFYIFGSHLSGMHVKEFLEPLINVVKNYKKPTRVFLCHASEDKATIEVLAKKIRASGRQVWFDKWEINVGDSIVDKIDSGLKEMTHLVVFFSRSSIDKPWVKKELSAALFRKLKDNSVQVIPVLLDKVDPPHIIADIKYADCSRDRQRGFAEIMQAITR